MNQIELSEVTDQELLEIAKKMKSTGIIHAILIGVMIGVIIYSIAKNSIGFFTLIPLFLAYRLIKTPDNSAAIKQEMKARKLK